MRVVIGNLLLFTRFYDVFILIHCWSGTIAKPSRNRETHSKMGWNC